MILRKAARVWRDRGIVGFLTFMLGRILVRRFHRVLYEGYARQISPPEPDEDRRVLLYDSQNTLPGEVLLFVGPGGEEYLEGVRDDDLLYVVKVDNRLVHYGFVMRRTRETAVLGEPRGTPIIGNCWTHPDTRGKGIYPFALRQVLQALRDRGIDRVLIETDVENIASRRGIEKAGFRQLRIYNALIVCNLVLFGSVEENARRRPKAWIIRR
jgi:RimJ/RimL family protein N-acetyltransferase